VFSGGGVAPVVVDERGEVLQLEGDPGVRSRRSIEEWSSSEGAHRRGADGGDARTESSVGEGLRWRKTDEEDAWAWTDEMNGARDEKEILAGGRRLRFNGKRRGGGPEGWTPHGGRAGERGRGRRTLARCGAACQRRGSGPAAARAGGMLLRDNGSTWLTGGPGHYGGPVVSGWVRRGAAH
jgi:hypothetical protein